MEISFSSIFEADLETVWTHLQNPKLLDFIAFPLVKFIYLEPNLPDKTWSEGDFSVKMKVFGFIPFGEQNIKIEFPARNSNYIKGLRDNGSGKLIKKWDHQIELQLQTKTTTKYTDTINFEAGILTPFVWCYATVFFKWRQYRWKKLIRSNFKQLD